MDKTRKFIIGVVTTSGVLFGALSLWTQFQDFGPTRPTGETRRSPASSSLTSHGLFPTADDLCNNFYQVACFKRPQIYDPTGFVGSDTEGENQALQIYQDIRNEHSDWNSDAVDEEFVSRVFNPKARGRITSAYKWVRRSMEKFINRQPETVLTRLEKDFLLARIRKTHLQLPPPATIYSDERQLFSKSEVFYERTVTGQLRLRVGGAYVLIARSWFNLVDTFAHELAHSIDPCEIKAIRTVIPAFNRLVKCFERRSLIAHGKDREECGKKDQASEIFADWMAAQVVADALNHFSTEFDGLQIVNAAQNSVRDLCEQEDDPHELDLENHPSPRVRIEKIFGLHPLIRGALGCEPLADTQTYCNLEEN